jgi:hypothetical protein
VCEGSFDVKTSLCFSEGGVGSNLLLARHLRTGKGGTLGRFKALRPRAAFERFMDG